MKNPPFFIIGCVRSGTTLLRDVLRKHPGLISPEETHFFRWSEPFGTPQSTKLLSSTTNSVLKKHREMDGITEEQFKEILNKSVSRSDLEIKYMQQYMLNNKFGGKRWFDKTPQNVYGAAMIAADFPGSKFVHIVRNPIDVVSSLRIGKVVKIDNLVGACNYWNEAAAIIFMLKKAYGHRVYEVKYEDFTSNFLPELEKMLTYLGENFDAEWFSEIVTVPKEHEHDTLFRPEELQAIEKLCGRWGRHYGYFAAK
ncbi:sulfotransferase family protein [Methylovulum psychrotolerans]|nr:sulfotransferase [Methylovulum psychrotolerans]